MKFISSTKVLFKSGRGGDGIIAWRRESRVRRGGPAGGNGGDGGSVYLEADGNMNSLFHLRHIRFARAEDGVNGQNKSRHGRNGEDLVLKVPCGTMALDASTGERLFDLLRPGQRGLVCQGGKGGRGNASFKSSFNSAPYLYELGDLPEEREVSLELQIISDVGFLGKPNSGKSSLLSLISNAKPRVAPFPFTTLIPVLGQVRRSGQSWTFADIPGLIRDASRGHGLGFEFLKHLNRCRVLLHLVDVSNPNYRGDIEEVESELRNYSAELFNRRRILVFNKIDLLPDGEFARLLSQGVPMISAKTGENVDQLLDMVFGILNDQQDNPTNGSPEYMEFTDDPNLLAPLGIFRRGPVWHVEHPNLKYWVNKIPRDTNDNVNRLFRKFDSLGVGKGLNDSGALQGDDVDIYGFTFKHFVA